MVTVAGEPLFVGTTLPFPAEVSPTLPLIPVTIPQVIDPDGPCEPVAPLLPCEPVAPVAPLPVTPCEPVAPLNPCGPVAPVAPAPVAPTDPSDPFCAYDIEVVKGEIELTDPLVITSTTSYSQYGPALVAAVTVYIPKLLGASLDVILIVSPTLIEANQVPAFRILRPAITC